jgi:hypothetical protein
MASRKGTAMGERAGVLLTKMPEMRRRPRGRRRPRVLEVEDDDSATNRLKNA